MELTFNWVTAGHQIGTALGAYFTESQKIQN